MAEVAYYSRRVWEPVGPLLSCWMALTLLVQFALAGIFHAALFVVAPAR